MALAFSVTNWNIKHGGGRKAKLVAITFDGDYANGTGWTVTPANLGFTTAIESMLPLNLAGYQIQPAISGVNAVLKAWKGNTEAGNSEAGLNTLVGLTLALGY